MKMPRPRKMAQPGRYRPPKLDLPGGYNLPGRGRVGKLMPAIKQFRPMSPRRGR